LLRPNLNSPDPSLLRTSMLLFQFPTPGKPAVLTSSALEAPLFGSYLLTSWPVCGSMPSATLGSLSQRDSRGLTAPSHSGDFGGLPCRMPAFCSSALCRRQHPLHGQSIERGYRQICSAVTTLQDFKGTNWSSTARPLLLRDEMRVHVAWRACFWCID
jgi:hypothetical protein